MFAPADSSGHAEPRQGGWQHDRLTLALRNRRDWLSFYDTRIANTVYCPTAEPPGLASPVRIDLSIHKGPRLQLEGRVSWRRLPCGDGRVEAGFRVRVSNAQRKLLDRIDAWMRSGVHNRRRHRRLPVRLRATYSTHERRRRVNFVRDLSLDGVFISASRLVPLDSDLRMTLIPPGNATPQRLTGRVARWVEEPHRRGMGIALSFDDEEARRRYAALVEQLEQQYISGDLHPRHLR